jgi:hypothetical protein
MNGINQALQQKSTEHQISDPKDFGQIANELCARALNDAKTRVKYLKQLGWS